MIENSLQTLFINILNPVNRITGRISDRVKSVMIYCLYIGIFAIYIAFRAKIFKHALYRDLLPDTFSRHMFSTILLLAITVLSIKEPLHKVPWRKSILITQMLTGIGIIIVSFIHPIGDGYRLFGFQLVTVLPCFYFVWNNRRDYENLFRPIAYAMTFVGMLFYAGTYLMAFRGRITMLMGRCEGVMPNANSFSLIGMELVLGALYLLVAEKRSWVKTCYCCAAAGMGIGIVILGQMRIAILTIGICFIVTVYFCLRYLKKKADKKFLIHALIGLILIFVCIEMSTMMVNINQAAIDRKNQAETASVEAGNADDADTDTKDNVEMALDRFKSSDDADLSSYSSGRIRIWKNFAGELNWLGHEYSKDKATELTGIPHLPYAHNIFFEIAYRCGVPVAVMAMLYYLICGIICIGFLFCRRENKPSYLLFPIISAIAFALEALLDCAVLPFFQAEALIFYLAISVMIDKDEIIRDRKK